jgi:hypothetical protein
MADSRIAVRACVFDAYGTLFDFASAANGCPGGPSGKTATLTALWRDKQLQYTWLRGLVQPLWPARGEITRRAGPGNTVACGASGVIGAGRRLTAFPVCAVKA